MIDNINLKKIITNINKKGVIPDGWLKRNHLRYPLVSNVNNVICLYISNNLENFFIERIKKELKKVSPDEKKLVYTSYVLQLIDALECCSTQNNQNPIQPKKG